MLEELDLYFNPAIGSGGAVSLIRALYTYKQGEESESGDN